MTHTQTMTGAQFAAYLDGKWGKPGATTERSLKNTNNAREAVRRGQAFENALEPIHEMYERTRRARLTKCPLPTRGIPRHGKASLPWKWIPDDMKSVLRIRGGTALTDFVGTLCKGGRSLWVEAKSTKSNESSLSIGEDKGNIKAAQLRRLRDELAFGAVCGLVWRNGDVLGVLNGHEILNALMVYESGKRKSVNRDRFVWLEPGDWDYLAVLEDEMGKGANRA